MRLLLKLIQSSCIAAFLALILSFPASAEVTPTFRVYLTAEAENNRPGPTHQGEFECSDKIYGVVVVTAPDRQKATEHLLIVNWLNPGNRLEQKTRYTFKSYGKGTQVWAWLKLSGSTGSSIGQIFDPAYGMDEFIGKWRAEFVIDGKRIKTLPFEVLC